MKVLFQSRPDALENWGGDTTQMLRTKEELEKLGVEIKIAAEMEPTLTGFDIVHVFNIQTPEIGMVLIRNAKRHGIPVALSTVFWDLQYTLRSRDYLKYHSDPRVRMISSLSRFLAAGLVRMHRSKIRIAQREMLSRADVLLPNSIAELEGLVSTFKDPTLRARAVIVPNGVSLDPPAEKSAETIRLLNELPDEYVLMVASFDPAKGQLQLIRETNDLPMVFIGEGTNTLYRLKCMDEAGKTGNVRFIAQVPHSQIGWFYDRARVHALPSLRESPGLATLEAAVHGANCVVSDHGPVAEYFGDDVWYCDPLIRGSVGLAVKAAWSAPKNTALRERIISQFTWTTAAEATLEAYKRITKEFPDS